MIYIFFKNQQFITQSARADYGSYFVTIYMETKPTGEKREKRNKKEKKRNNR